MNKNLENHAKNRGFSDKTQEKRRIRKESPPPLRPYGKKPWRTIITVISQVFAKIIAVLVIFPAFRGNFLRFYGFFALFRAFSAGSAAFLHIGRIA